MKKVTFNIILLFFILIVAGPAYSHKVNVFGYAEDGRVFVEAYFVDGTKAKDAVVEVYDGETGEKLLQGRTDQEGMFSFRIPRLTALKLVLVASMGHKNDYTISKEEIAEAMGITLDQPSPQKAGTEQPAESYSVQTQEPIEDIIEKVMDRKLQPIKSILLQLQQQTSRPGVTEILGGIGYIIGLMGIVLYFKSKRRD